ncbi:unnamed protein product [Albugo candida]|uniref:Inosine/uridine-preferring nucleoside hydrolase domain-containing protein n=1 Tax=Albugo candida TaxID=65357 RepID=A0A024FV66_9STRA|nr:unnamed protein product [Albugo candida]|eukprot:CCI10827.1 unnamed protein product [Albugo candida]
MYRFKSPCQLVCLWILFQFSLNYGEPQATCIWITDAGEDDILLMDLLARSGKVEERCPSGLHIGIVFPSLSKEQMVLELLDNNQDFKKLVSIHLGAATEKALCYRSPFNGENTSFSDFLKDHLSKDTSSRILITAPCVDLALAIKQSNCFTTINKIEEIFWAGGFHEENTETIVAYNWKRNISATQSILEIAELRFKTTIVTRASHPYGWKIDSRSFPGLIEKVADVYNVYNGHAAKVQVTDIMAETGFLSYRDTSIFGDDLVATMLMFYPELIQEKRMVKYELQEVKSDEPVLISKKSQARKRRRMKHKKDKEEKERKKVKDRMRMPETNRVKGKILEEREMPTLFYPKHKIRMPNKESRNQPIFTQYPYEHTFVKKIKTLTFQDTIIALFDRYSHNQELQKAVK